jgi:hypothetical protein
MSEGFAGARRMRLHKPGRRAERTLFLLRGAANEGNCLPCDGHLLPTWPAPLVFGIERTGRHGACFCLQAFRRLIGLAV